MAVGKSSPPGGPSVSHIYCDRRENTCHEEMANIIPIGEAFSLAPDSAEYRITRWDEHEIVAENPNVQAGLLAGSCHLLGVLKIDLRHQRVYAYQTLTEPVLAGEDPSSKIIDSKGICEAANNTLWELHADTMFTFSPNAKTVVVAPAGVPVPSKK